MANKYAVCYFENDGQEQTPAYHTKKSDALKMAKVDWAERGPEIGGIGVFTLSAPDEWELQEIEYQFDPIWMRGHV